MAVLAAEAFGKVAGHEGHEIEYQDVQEDRIEGCLLCLEDRPKGLKADFIGAETEAILTINDAIGKPYRTYQDMPQILDVGDTVVAKIVDLDRKRTPILSIMGRELGRARDGFIIEITPSKIPRLIGKKGSMINMILKETNCQVTIGQNGKVLISGRNMEDEELVVKVIRKIEAEAHTSGLTNRIQEYLKEEKESRKNE